MLHTSLGNLRILLGLLVIRRIEAITVVEQALLDFAPAVSMLRST
jgi:hypothetical protein